MTETEPDPPGGDERAAVAGGPVRLDAMELPRGTRLVHIGPHKTGTTAVQAALFAARAELPAQGVAYVSEGRHAMTAVLAGMGLPNAWGEGREPPPRWKWTRLLDKVNRAKEDRVVLSSEFFADGRPEAIRRVVDELDPARVHVVVTLRPLARILPSQWQQGVQNQWTTPFDDWVRELLEDPDGKAGSMFWRRHRHDALIRRWADVVGADRVTAIALDESDHDMVLRVFEGLTGLRSGTLQPVASLSNRSMTLPEIEVIRAFNVAYQAEKLPKTVYTRLIRFGAAALMEARPPSPDEPRITLPRWANEPVAEAARGIVGGIRASRVRVIGDLDGLTAVPDGRDPESGPLAVSPEVAASALMGVVVATGLARGSGDIRVTAEDPVQQGSAVTPLRLPRVVQEPPELFRLSSTQLAIVLLRRFRAAAMGFLRFGRR